MQIIPPKSQAPAQRSPKGANAERSRNLNRQNVLGRIHAAGARGRAELARDLGLSTQAVSNIISGLMAEGLVREMGTRAGARGLPAVLYGLDPVGGFALGVEIRPDAFFIALVDLAGHQIVASRSTISDPHPDQVARAIRTRRDALIAKAGIAPDRLIGTGIVMPGPFGRTGLSGLSADLPGWEDTDPGTLLSEALEGPVEIANDANAAAMAERLGGVAQGVGSFAYLYFGTGLGLGIIHNGQLVTGAFGNAGEIGQLPIHGPDGTAPLESRLSRLSVNQSLGRRLDIADLDRLFQQGDPDLSRWLDQARNALSQAAGIVENLFDPATIVLGGAMPDALLDALISGAVLPDRSVANRPEHPLPRMMRGQSGRMTATLGAAALVLDRLFTPNQYAI
ncbi:ROK family transcriptional regulator [Phaeobacter sp. J2-8]|uniref:ROK family transcriptional regulator n=1 Tax=Phaeobacter sp. J2-8 TaxID=2931394 RepID=UPI001FD2EEF0|nr:ROK family transcriptional regulator [Phaeobacter sp. J2-8]MCJ7874171.1 ROK family transcriptional regulator [Phaeobacter sp. J2-8]